MPNSILSNNKTDILINSLKIYHPFIRMNDTHVDITFLDLPTDAGSQCECLERDMEPRFRHHQAICTPSVRWS